MRIESLEIRNYRSIRHLKLEGLGAINVLYGENGAGKSNILAAIDLLFSVMRHWMEAVDYDYRIEPGDFRQPHVPGADLVVAARLVKSTSDETGAAIGFEFTASAKDGIAKVVRATLDARDLVESAWDDRAFTAAGLAPLDEIASSFRLSQAVRSLEAEPTTAEGGASGSARITRLLREGRLKQALVEAVTNPDIEVRAGLKRMQKVFAGPPLNRPEFDPIHDPAANRYELNELHYGPNGKPYAIPVDLAGLGIQQIYHVMAAVFLGPVDIVAVEEPEAHLHPRTSGMQLRTLLKRSVDEGHVDQLFIATHSNLFDLDPTGYFLVRNDPEAGTVVERRTDFAELDRAVFWEPGPARHALQDMLRYLPADTVVLRRPDGTPISASEMLTLLQADDPAAVAFVDDVQATAVRTVQRLAQREKRSS